MLPNIQSKYDYLEQAEIDLFIVGIFFFVDTNKQVFNVNNQTEKLVEFVISGIGYV